jgi:hypothetical protein
VEEDDTGVREAQAEARVVVLNVRLVRAILSTDIVSFSINTSASRNDGEWYHELEERSSGDLQYGRPQAALRGGVAHGDVAALSLNAEGHTRLELVREPRLPERGQHQPLPLCESRQRRSSNAGYSQHDLRRKRFRNS